MSDNQYAFSYSGPPDKIYDTLELIFGDSLESPSLRYSQDSAPINKVNSNTLFLNGNSVAMRSVLGSSKARLVAIRSESIEHRVFLSDEIEEDLLQIKLTNRFGDELIIPNAESADQFNNWIRDTNGYFRNIAIESLSDNIAGVNFHEVKVEKIGKDLDRYTQFSYLPQVNYPHYDLISYSNRVTNLDGFISNSMLISKNKYNKTGLISNVYVRPDFSKQFLGFEIAKHKDSRISISVGESDEDIIVDTTSLNPDGYSFRVDSVSHYGHDDYRLDIIPKIPGVEVSKVDSKLLVDLDKMPQLTFNEFTIYASNLDGNTDSLKVIFSPADKCTVAETYYLDPASTTLSRFYRPAVTWNRPELSSMQGSSNKYITGVESSGTFKMKKWNEVLKVKTETINEVEKSTVTSLFRVRRWNTDFGGVFSEITDYSAVIDRLVPGGVISVMTVHGPTFIEYHPPTEEEV